MIKALRWTADRNGKSWPEVHLYRLDLPGVADRFFRDVLQKGVGDEGFGTIEVVEFTQEQWDNLFWESSEEAPRNE